MADIACQSVRFPLTVSTRPHRQGFGPKVISAVLLQRSLPPGPARKTGFGQSLPETRFFAVKPSSEAFGGARSALLFSRALQLARTQDFEAAREAFQECVMSCPTHAKAWISWAQMEKRQKTAIANDHYRRCQGVLQQGLLANPDSAKLCQTWGLLELQRGNMVAAVKLLERCVLADPSLSPVLKWKAVQVAQQAVVTRRRAHRLSMRAHRVSVHDSQMA
ncbi:hypothetical protein WJX73_004675 [Symbiochloris irregularis]|uniref:Uncharacterized protein n=1 Tax=Symbiochloris irregularis TaxID=706552 RepID=A0AAW1NNE5_9CHLO